MNGQSRKLSFLEACLSVGTGYLVALVTQLIIYPWFDIDITFHAQLSIAAIFIFVSIIRTYLWRRAFNWWGRNHA